jgi:hypothetical protein
MGSPNPLGSANYMQQNLNDVTATRDEIARDVLPTLSRGLNNLMLLNTSLNSTNYIKTDLDGKLTDVKKNQNTAYNNLIKTRYTYLQKVNTINQYKFWINVHVGAIFVACIAFVLLTINQMPAWLNYSIIGFVAFVYCFIVLLALKNNSTRHNDDWNKFYFGPYKPTVQ